MEPTNSDDIVNQTNAAPSHKRFQFSRKKWIVVAVATLVIVMGIAFALSISKETGEKATQANVYYDRDGFDRSKLSEAIGDPAPLVTRAGAEVVAYKGAKVVQACNLLTVEDIRKQDLQLDANSLTAFERTYFDGQSNAALETFPTSLASMGDSNSCMYPIHEPRGTVNIDVYQPAYNQASAINYELRRYQATGTVAGMARYERAVEDSKIYLFREGNTALVLDIQDIKDKKISDKLIAVVLANYKREKAAPTGPIQFAYSSPVFNKAYFNSCSAITAKDVEQVFSTPAKPLITERVATATGVIYYPSQKEQTRYSRIENDCIRPAVSNGFSNRKSLTAETTSFLQEEAAKLEMTSGRRLDSNVRELTEKVGDDAYFSDTTGSNPEMVIRSGRFVINLSVFDQTQPGTGAEQMIQQLTPIAKLVVERARGVQ